ncbi:MAG: hypothetical protein WDO71_03640 [Bacteroidota bacterium]
MNRLKVGNLDIYELETICQRLSQFYPPGKDRFAGSCLPDHRIFLLPGIVSNKSSSSSVPVDTAWVSAARKLEIKDAEKDKKTFNSPSGENDYTYQYDRSVSTSTSSGSLFHFDPNTIDEEGWKKLGLKEKTIHTIQNYLRKGGHFYKRKT